MLPVEVMFCPECSRRLISLKLFLFWKSLVLTSLEEGNFLYFRFSDDKSLDFLSQLEKKAFIVTHEDEESIIVKVKGIRFEYPQQVRICLDPCWHPSIVELDLDP